MLAFSTIATILLAGTYPTTLHVTRSTRANPIAVTGENQSGSLHWANESALIVRVVQVDMPNLVISERAPRAEVSGHELKLCYNYEPPNPNTPQGVTTPSASPVLLEFTVVNLPPGSYKQFIAPCWPAG
jgi:hypothetical protein